MADEIVDGALYYPIELIYNTDKTLTFTIGQQDYTVNDEGCTEYSYDDCTGTPSLSAYNFAGQSFSAAIVSTTDATSGGLISITPDVSQISSGIVSLEITPAHTVTMDGWIPSGNTKPTYTVGKWYLTRTDADGDTFVEVYGKVSLNLATKQGVN